jgi:hypothetical protein
MSLRFYSPHVLATRRRAAHKDQSDSASASEDGAQPRAKRARAKGKRARRGASSQG